MNGRINRLKEQETLEKISKAFDECAVDLDYTKLKQRIGCFKFRYSDSIFTKLKVGRIKGRF